MKPVIESEARKPVLIKPLHLLKDSALELMAKDFERPAWKKTDQDREFSETAARALRTEQARRRALRLMESS